MKHLATTSVSYSHYIHIHKHTYATLSALFSWKHCFCNWSCCSNYGEFSKNELKMLFVSHNSQKELCKSGNISNTPRKICAKHYLNDAIPDFAGCFWVLDWREYLGILGAFGVTTSSLLSYYIILYYIYQVVLFSHGSV